MGYRLIALLLLASVLLACGTPDAAPTPTRQTTASYPTPSESAPSPVPATVTPMPTVLVSATAMPTPRLIELTPVTTTALTATLVQSIPLDAKQMPTTLVGWSPDERYLMYVQNSLTIDLNHRMTLGSILLLDLEKKIAKTIVNGGVIVNKSTDRFVYDINLPQWDDECCSIIASFLEHDRQVIRLLDIQGQAIKDLANIEPSLARYYGGKIYRIEKGKISVNNRILETPLISKNSAITATAIISGGIYTHTNQDVQYIDSTTTWMISGADSYLKNAPAGEVMEIVQMEPSQNGHMVAITTTPRGTNEMDLWVLDRLTNEYRQVGTHDAFGYQRWSTDSTLLAYRHWYGIEVFDLQTGQIAILPDEYVHAPVWHPNLHRLAVINEANQSIDIFDISREKK